MLSQAKLVLCEAFECGGTGTKITTTTSQKRGIKIINLINGTWNRASSIPYLVLIFRILEMSICVDVTAAELKQLHHF